MSSTVNTSSTNDDKLETVTNNEPTLSTGTGTGASEKSDEAALPGSSSTSSTTKETLDRHDQLQLLMGNMTEDQLERYEVMRRVSIPRTAVKKLMQQISGSVIPNNVVVAMSGISKVFIIQVIEHALEIKKKSGHEGPLQPKHVHEAVRQLRLTETTGLRENRKRKLSLDR